MCIMRSSIMRYVADHVVCCMMCQGYVACVVECFAVSGLGGLLFHELL